jgi:hypothetical protein
MIIVDLFNIRTKVLDYLVICNHGLKTVVNLKSMVLYDYNQVLRSTIRLKSMVFSDHYFGFKPVALLKSMVL